MRSCVTVCSATGFSKSNAAERALLHMLSSVRSASSDHTHAMVDAPRSQATLSDFKSAALAQKDIGDRDADILKTRMGMSDPGMP